MSREHAVLFLDTESKVSTSIYRHLFPTTPPLPPTTLVISFRTWFTYNFHSTKVAIKDSNSLHGTYVNKIQLGRQERRQIQAGDILTFGMTVDRGILQYYPLQVEADITFGTQVYVLYESCTHTVHWLTALCSSRPATVTYKVPDDSEIEDISSDEDVYKTSPEMEYAARVLKEHDIRPAKEWHTSIDLTSDNEGAIVTADAQQPRVRTGEAMVPSPPLPSSQDFYIDLTQSFNKPTPETQNEVENGLTDSTQTGKVIHSGEFAEDEEDDFEEAEDECLPDVSVDSYDSEESEHSEEEEEQEEEKVVEEEEDFPPSDETTLAVTGFSDDDDQAGMVPVFSLLPDASHS